MTDLSQAVVLADNQISENGGSVTCIATDETSLSLPKFTITLPSGTTVAALYEEVVRVSSIAQGTFLLSATEKSQQDSVETVLDWTSTRTLADLAGDGKRLKLCIKPKDGVEAVLVSDDGVKSNGQAGSSGSWKSMNNASSSGAAATAVAAGLSGDSGRGQSSAGMGMSYSNAASKAVVVGDYAGLVNQAMTCYLNSVLQTQFMTPEFRNAIYNWQYSGGPDEEVGNIPFQLQKLFATMQTTQKRAVKTVDVTKSFGWTSADSWQQHDVQELCRVMFDALEKTFKGTAQDALIKQLYEGTMQDYVKCLACGYESTRSDTYMDISLVIKPFGATKACASVEEALKVHVTPETLDGSNQYFCEKCNSKQDGHKGLKFLSFPCLLTLQLKRFDFDYRTMHRIKLNNRMTFPVMLDLNGFIAKEGDACELVRRQSVSLGTPVEKGSYFPQRAEVSTSGAGTPSGLSSVDGEAAAAADAAAGNGVESSADEADDSPDYRYELLSIMVHSGSAIGGHYYAYIRSMDTRKWYSFNDSNVTPITNEDISKTFGGSTTTTGYTSMYSSSANAYMLIYRRIDPKRNAKFLKVEEFPPHVARLVKVVEDHEEQERRQVEIERSHCRIPVFYRSKVEDTPVSKTLEAKNDTPFREVVDLARRLHGLDDVPLERCRLVKYDEHYDSCECSYEGREEENLGHVLGGTRQSYLFDLLLETHAEGEEFEKYSANSTTLKVYSVDLESGTVSKRFRTVRVPLGWKVQQVSEHLSKKLGFDASTLRLVVQKYGTDITLLQRSLTMSEEGFYRAAIVYAEHRVGRADDVPFRTSQLYKVISRHLHTIKWSVTLPPAPQESNADVGDDAEDAATNGPRAVIVEFDRRSTVGNFKQHLEQYMHGLATDQFRLYKILKNGQEFELTRPADPMSYHTDSAMKVVLGRAVGADEYRIPVWFFEPNKDVFMTSLGDVIIGKGMTVPNILAEVTDLCKTIAAGSVSNQAKHTCATAVVNAPASHLRLRRKNYRTPTNVLEASQQVGRDIAVYSGWELSVEVLDAPDKYDNKQTAVFVRRWHPNSNSFGPMQEILLPDLALKTALAAIAQLSGLPLEQLDFAKGIGSFPYHYSPLEMDSLAWNPSVTYLDRIPVSIMNDSCLLYYRDRRDEAEEVTPERRQEIERQELTRTNQLNRTAMPSYRKERALKIKTAD